jgi:hypothetical protein
MPLQLRRLSKRGSQNALVATFLFLAAYGDGDALRRGVQLHVRRRDLTLADDHVTDRWVSGRRWSGATVGGEDR